MAIGYGIAVPKGKTRKQLKAKRDRADAYALKIWRDAVWRRERPPLWAEGLARCQECQRTVNRHGDRCLFGHVHHIVSRRHKATRYDPKNGKLLCRACHNAMHGREF